MNWIIATGNPSDGFTYTGPFETPDDASKYAEYEDLHDWWLIQLTSPTEA